MFWSIVYKETTHYLSDLFYQAISHNEVLAECFNAHLSMSCYLHYSSSIAHLHSKAITVKERGPPYASSSRDSKSD